MNVTINLNLDVNKSLVDELKSSENDVNRRVLFQIEEQIASELYHSLRKLAEIYRLLSIVSDSDSSELIKLAEELFIKMNSMLTIYLTETNLKKKKEEFKLYQGGIENE